MLIVHACACLKNLSVNTLCYLKHENEKLRKKKRRFLDSNDEREIYCHINQD